MKPSQHIPALTGIRAVAAGIVFFGHMIERHLKDVPDLLQYGWTGVNIFFALSGYLFTYLYSNDILNNTFSWKNYIKRRIIRIYPLTTLLIVITVFSLWGKLSPENVIFHLTLLHAWFPLYRMSLNSPMWTLTLEESYYFMAPILIYHLGRFYDNLSARTLSGHQGFALFIRIIIPTIVLLFLTFALSHGTTGLYQSALDYVTGFWDKGAWTFTIFGRIIDFVSGMLAASIARIILPKKRWGDVIVLVGFAVYMAAIHFIASHGGPGLAGNHRLSPYAYNGIAVGAAIIMYGLHTGGLISSILSSKPAIVLGEASFALYLIQLMPVLWWPHIGLDFQWWLEGMGLHFVVAAIISYGVLNLVSMGIFYGFERPVGAMLRKRFLPSNSSR